MTEKFVAPVANTQEQLKTWNLLSSRFQRPCPAGEHYALRLAQELELITALKFAPHFLRVLEVLELTRDIPHITRGSAGSSLMCYLLGISDIDPVVHDIPIVRFINPLRDDLPDIDLDFPQPYHREVLERIYKHWPGRAARLSNYVKYREKSARKEAARRVANVQGKIPADQDVGKLVPDHLQAEWQHLTHKLIGKKRCISKHPGGVVVFDKPPAKSLIRADNQILLDKYEVEDLAHLKIDVLSNRGLAQLLTCNGRHPREYPEQDDATQHLLAHADTIGICQGESPVMRRTLRALKPQTRTDLALALALIRPAAITGRSQGVFFREFMGHNGAPGDLKYRNGLIYDEDAINLIMMELSIDPYRADMYRRGFVKKNEEIMFDFLSQLGNHPERSRILNLLTNIDGFGLCKAHALNLAYMVWALAWEKAHNTQMFWYSTLTHNNSMYRPWLHIEQAKRAGWRIQGKKRPWLVRGNCLYTPGWRQPLFETAQDQLERQGFWCQDEFMPGCYYTEIGNIATFRGLIATHRIYNSGSGDYLTFATLGCSPDQVIDVQLPGVVKCKNWAAIEGQATIEWRAGVKSTWVNKFQLLTAQDLH
jgi:DNA polymerase III alpha subunit